MLKAVPPSPLALTPPIDADRLEGRYSRQNGADVKTPVYESFETALPVSPSRSPEGYGTHISPDRSQHRRQLSTPNPKDKRTSGLLLSPTRAHFRHQSQDMSFTGDGRERSSHSRSPTRSPARSPGQYDGSGWGSPGSFRESHGTTPVVTTTPKNTTQTRLGFLASSVSAFTSRMSSQPQTPVRTGDNLYDLDVEAALFSTSPSDRDTFSPAAYKNLQTNAVGLLRRMQMAYRERTNILQEVQAEHEAQKEEVEETELRIRHYKNQLEKMAAKASEQEKAMQLLVAEVQAEKRARREERARADKFLRLNETSEDLGAEEKEKRNRWRESHGTVKSDTSMDTDGDGESAESESIFSRCRSPTAMTIATENETVDTRPPSAMDVHVSKQTTPRPKPAPQFTTLQRLVKGISAVKEESADESGASTCRNCQGRDSSIAWDTVSLLRDENTVLKSRVASLEIAVEGALDVVNGVGVFVR
ncbi:hypothetical protein F5Y18DRAFT_234483 [Xylariaceae sp. FL1019]|nr:hypothetical protein F5Y18DRAFT_234483 [Xylariaceae sp. FL1019]